MSSTAIPASARFEFRVKPDTKQRIERAAELVHETASDFARTAAEERAEQVLRLHHLVTMVPADFFDALLDALDDPPVPNEALKRGNDLRRSIVEER